MLTKKELLELLGTTETVRLEKTVLMDDRDKFCAFKMAIGTSRI